MYICICTVVHIQDSIFDPGHLFEIDKCGEVKSLSEHAAILIPFYYAPILLLMVLIAILLVVRMSASWPFRLAIVTACLQGKRVY